jgi:hypothetical protein
MNSYNWKLSPFVITAVLFALLMQACSSKKKRINDFEDTTVVKNFNVVNLAQTNFKITNTSNYPISFSLKFNGGPHYSTTEMAQLIRQMPEEFNQEPLERKAWRFVRDNLKFNPAFSEKEWQHNSHLLLNSLGFGQCDDHAVLLVQLWQELGFESRVWSLTGHVVSEVKVNKKWQMFDAAYGVYYYNEDMKTASVHELSSKSWLIKSPSIMMPFIESNDFHTQFARYNMGTISNYSSNKNNTISEMGTHRIPAVSSEISLPAHAEISFPLTNGPNKPAILYNSSLPKEDFIQYISVNIPKHVTGAVRLPFVIAAIQGDGLVQFQNKETKISDIQTYAYSEEYVSNVGIIENFSGINITYYINPKVFKTQTSNEIKIITENPGFIAIDTFTAIDSINNSIRPFVRSNIAKRNYSHFASNRQLWQDEVSRIKTIDQLKEVVALYYETQENLSKKEQKTHTIKANYYVNQLIKSSLENEELIIEISKRSDLMYFINIIESNEIEEIIRFLETIKTQINRKKLE